MAGTPDQRMPTIDQLVNVADGHAGSGSVSSRAQRRRASDVTCSIRYRNGLVHRPAAPSARAGKCVLSVDAREESAPDTCEPSVSSKSRGRVYKLIDLVSSSSIDDTVRVFAIPVVLTWPISSTQPPTNTRLKGVQKRFFSGQGAGAYRALLKEIVENDGATEVVGRRAGWPFGGLAAARAAETATETAAMAVTVAAVAAVAVARGWCATTEERAVARGLGYGGKKSGKLNRPL